MNYEDFFSDSLETIKNEGSYRTFANLSRKAGQFPKADLLTENGLQEVTIWCSNDYLGIGQHPKVLEAMHKALDQYGSGSGGTRNISGTTDSHIRLEKELADLHDKEAALLFGSGYIANETALMTLANKIPNVVIISDEHNHASMIQGIRNSRAEKRIFKHNDLEDLEKILNEYPIDRPKILAFESVYSMSGTVAPIKEICNLAEAHNAFTYLDEVHGIGLYGKKGGGVAQKLEVAHRIDLIQGTLGKAVGLVGGYISGSRSMVDFIRSFASGFIFTTSLPPVITEGASQSLRIIKQGQHLREAHQAHVSSFKTKLKNTGIPFWDNPSHIVPIIVGDAFKCKAITNKLLEDYKIYVQPINYPTVRAGTERMRFTPSALHSQTLIDECVQALESIWNKVVLKNVA